mgnify:CR=1 FL=1
MLGKGRTAGIESQHKAVFFLALFCAFTNVAFKFLVANDHIVLFGEDFDLLGNFEGIAKVDSENAIKEADKERECKVIGEPLEGVEDIGVDKKIIYSTQQRPKEREQWANYAFVVEFIVGVVPKLDVHTDDENFACNELNEGHSDRHNDEEERFLQGRAGDVDVFFQTC